MKTRRITIITLLVACAAALVAGIIIPAGSVTGERFISDVRQSYRSASLVVSGKCEDTFTGAEGSRVSRIRVNDVLAGHAFAGDLLQVEGELSEGVEYLLYLDNGDDVNFAEDQQTYVSVSAEPFVIVDDDTVEYGGAAVPLERIKKDMVELDKVVTSHAGVYYHGSLAGLSDASESIFIGRVKSVSSMKKTSFRSQEGGNIVERTAQAAVVTVEVYGSVKGALRYGSEIQLMYIPESTAVMTDSASLEPVSCGTEDIIKPEEDGTYLFFLADDPDAKQDYSFPVNPVQGWVRVENDVLSFPEANTALAGYGTLPQLVSDMKSIQAE